MKLRSKSTALATTLAATVMFQTYALSAFANNADAPGEGIAWTTLLMPTVLILGAAAAATFVLKRWKGAVGGRDGPLQLIHVIALGPRERLALVKVGARYLVVGITPNNVNRIAELYDIQRAGADSSPEHPNGDSTNA
jgi:flagellar protein FliO/FliZ